MNILKGQKYRLNTTPEQSKLLFRWSGLLRRLYNTALRQRLLAYDLCRKTLSDYDQSSELTQLKQEYPEFKLPPAQALQQTLSHLQNAYDRFFKGVADFPKFKKRKHYVGIHIPQFKKESVQRLSKYVGQVELPKLGLMTFRWSKKLKGNIRSCSLSYEGNHWYITFKLALAIKDPANIPTTSLGLDVGCNTSVATSKPIDATHTHNLPVDTIKKIENAIAHRQRVMAYKKKGSRAWKTCVSHIRRLNYHLTCIRHDFIHKLTSKIADTQGYIFVENLSIKDMIRSASGTLENPGTNVAQKSGLNRSIQRQGWGLVFTFLDYKCRWKHRIFRKVDAAYTSQTCHLCKYVHKDNRERGSTKFHCQNCRLECDADVNAARNIEEAGLALLASEGYPLRNHPDKT